MKPKHRKIATRQWTRSAVANRTRSKDMMKMPLSMRGGPTLQKRDGSPLPKQKPVRPFKTMENIVGHRISHGWKEGNEPVTQWDAIILDQLPTNPSLYLLKYDGVDCVYGMELHNDERILNLRILPNKVSLPQETNTHFANMIVGKAVIQIFEGTNGSKDDWKGMVLEEVQIMKSWFYTTYKKDPVLYIYDLMNDYMEGNLHIIPGSMDESSGVARDEVSTITTKFYISYKKDPILYLYDHLDDYTEGPLHIRPECPPEEEAGTDVLTGKCVQYNKRDRTQKTGKIVYKVPTKSSVYFIKFDNDFHIYIYDLVKIC